MRAKNTKKNAAKTSAFQVVCLKWDRFSSFRYLSTVMIETKRLTSPKTIAKTIFQTGISDISTYLKPLAPSEGHSISAAETKHAKKLLFNCVIFTLTLLIPEDRCSLLPKSERWYNH